MPSLLPTPEPPDPVEGALGHFEHSNWVKASLKALDAGTVHQADANIGGPLTAEAITIDKPSSEEAILTLQGNGPARVQSKNAAGVDRWRLDLGDATAEGGNNSGSRFKLLAYGDTGALRHTVLDADRNTGLLTVVGSPTAAKGIATKEYADAVVPIGLIAPFGGSVAPAGWHLCDGSAHGSSALAAVIGSANTPDLRGMWVVGAGGAYAVGAKGGVESVVLTQAQTPVKSHSHTIDHDHGPVTSGAGTAHSHVMSHDHPAATSSSVGNHNHGGYGNNWYGSSQDQNPAGTDYSPIGQGPGHPDPPIAPGEAGAHNHTTYTGYMSGSTGTESGHTHSVDLPNFTGSSGAAADATATAHENRPPYYALVYIIKKV